MDWYICILLLLLIIVIYFVVRAELEDSVIEHYGAADRGNGLLRADTIEESASIGWTSMRNSSRTIPDTSCGNNLADGESPIHGHSGDSAGSMARYMVRD